MAELPPAERVADKRVTWAEAGSGFTVCNAGEGEWRQVCWEFKQRPRRSEAEVHALLSSAIYTTCVGTDLLFENEYCRAWDLVLSAARRRRRGRAPPPRPRLRLCLRCQGAAARRPQH